MNGELFRRLDDAINKRSPVLSSRLHPGLDATIIAKVLNKAGAVGNIQPIIDLFSWKNGSTLDPLIKEEDWKFFPHAIYMFLNLEKMVANFKGFKELAKYSPKYSEVAGRFFPLFWDGRENFLAIDLSPTGKGAIVFIDPHAPHLMGQICPSLEDLIEKAIEGNLKNEKVPGVPSYRPHLISLSLMVVEGSIKMRNPTLAGRFRRGLAENEIRALLRAFGVNGDVEPLIDVYSWKNGTLIDELSLLQELSVFPNPCYVFPDLETMLKHYRDFKMASGFHPHRNQLQGQYFPMFWDNATGYLAVDTKPSTSYRVVLLDFDSEELVKPAYPSFETFLDDFYRANASQDRLTCFK